MADGRKAWALAQGEASAAIDERRRIGRARRRAGGRGEDGIDDQPAELVRWQVAPLRHAARPARGRPDRVVAGGFGEPEMRKGIGEARQIVAAEREGGGGGGAVGGAQER